MVKAYKRLTYPERLIIEKLYKRHMGMTELMELAAILNRDRSTISREIKKNTKDGILLYCAKDAQKRAERESKQRVSKMINRGRQKHNQIKEIWEKSPYLTQNQIAEKVGCSRSTVAKYLKEISQEISEE